jgi:hypothetical protein
VQLIYPGPNHEVGNILVHFPAQKLSVMTDVVMPGWAPYRGWGQRRLPARHAGHPRRDPGHVCRTGTPADVQQSRDFLTDTIVTTQKAMGSISYADAAAGIDSANAWAVQTVWFARIADAVSTELAERWGDKIAAVDTFTPATVEALVVSLSTDAPAHLP